MVFVDYFFLIFKLGVFRGGFFNFRNLFICGGRKDNEGLGREGRRFEEGGDKGMEIG